MGDEDPNFNPVVGDQVWYDYNDDWAEATIIEVNRDGTYDIEVEEIGIVENVSKADILPVEYEDEDGAEDGAEELVDSELAELLKSVGEDDLAQTLSEGGIQSVGNLDRSTEDQLKELGVTSSKIRRKLLTAAQKALGGGSEEISSSDLKKDRNNVMFPAGPLGIDINQRNGKIIVTASKGVAKENGVETNDVLVRINNVDIVSKLKGVADAQKCAEVKKIVGSFSRPLRMVFEKGSEPEDDDDASSVASSSVASSSVASESTTKSSKKRWSIFGKKKSASGSEAPEDDSTVVNTAVEINEDEDAPVTTTSTFEAGALGLSVTNRSSDGALVVTKANGQAADNGVQVGDEIIALNDQQCQGYRSDQFKKLIQQAGRPFDLTVTRGEADSSSKSSSGSAASKQEKKQQKEDEGKKKRQKEKEKEEEEERRRKEEEEAVQAQEDEESEESGADKKKDFKVGDEVWYDDGEDWVEATILKLGSKLTLKVQETGKTVKDIEYDWIAAMEFEDDEDQEKAKEEEGEEEEEEENELEMLANMAASSAKKSKKGGGGGGKAKKETADEKQQRLAAERERAAAAKARAARERELRKDTKKASPGMRLPSMNRIKALAKQKKSYPSAKYMKQYQASLVDKDKAVDNLHRARTARMTYASMVTYASFHSGGDGAGNDDNAEEDKQTALAKAVRKKRSKSIEKRGPQVHEGESHYQYVTRKRREEAEDKMLERERQREERWEERERQREEEMEYRQRLEEEYLENHPEERYSDEEQDWED